MAPPTIRKAKKPTPPAGPNTMTIISGVLGAVILGVLLSLWPDGTVTGSTSSALEAFFKSKQVQFTGVKVLCTSPTQCKLTATRDIRNGELLVKTPATSILEPRAIMQSDIGKLVLKNNASITTGYAESTKLGATFTNLFLYAFYLAELKKDPNSGYAAWFDALPTSKELGGALFWEEDMDNCIDTTLAGEAKSIRLIASEGAKCAKDICDDAEGGCPLGVPTEEDLRLALGTYLHRNYQDQAIIIGADFAVTDNSRAGISPQFEQQAGQISMIAQSSYKKGDAINLNFGRGPSTLLTSQGIFDEHATGVDARIRINPDTKDAIQKKYCLEKQAELNFAANGKPRDNLLSCIGALVSTKEERKKNFKKNIKALPLRSYILGNLSGLISNNLEEVKKTIAELAGEGANQCDDNAPLSNSMTKYRNFVLEVLQKNLDYATNEWQKLDPQAYLAAITRGNAEAKAKQEAAAGGSVEPLSGEEDVTTEVNEAPETP